MFHLHHSLTAADRSVTQQAAVDGPVITVTVITVTATDTVTVTWSLSLNTPRVTDVATQ